MLDLGTGNGCYLSALQRHFPKKSYLGIDKNPQYIALAKRKFHDRPLIFECIDIFDHSGLHKFIISRLVAQHLDDLNGFLNSVSNLLEKEGVFLSIEPNDRLRTFCPNSRNIESLFEEFERSQLDRNLNRNAGRILSETAHEYGFEVIAIEDIIIPSTLPNYRDLFSEFYSAIFLLFEKWFEVPANYEVLGAELHAWVNEPDSYAQVGLRAAWYRKIQNT